MQATSNARDGVSFVQTADGAMEEVHAVLQRMNELSVNGRNLHGDEIRTVLPLDIKPEFIIFPGRNMQRQRNDTLSESDRAALNDELEKLRAKIDRIDQSTEFNEQPV